MVYTFNMNIPKRPFIATAVIVGIAVLATIAILVGRSMYLQLSNPTRQAAMEITDYAERHNFTELHHYNRVKTATVSKPSFEYYFLSSEADLIKAKNGLTDELLKLGYRTQSAYYTPGEEIAAGCSFTFSPRDDVRCATLGYDNQKLTSATSNDGEPFWIISGSNTDRSLEVYAEVTDNTYVSRSNDDTYGEHDVKPSHTVIAIRFSAL